MLGSFVFGTIPLIIVIRAILVFITILLGLSLVGKATAGETSPAAGATASGEAATTKAAETSTTESMATLTTHHLDNDLGVDAAHTTAHATTKHIRGVH